MNRMRHMIGTLILVAMVVLNLSFTSSAYTEEQKQQAKAWLSAHGYSPDMGGANQAYQDYLNGKFDEELGVDVNGDGIPASTEVSTEAATEASGENAAEEDTEETGTSEAMEDLSGNQDESAAESVEDADETTTETMEEKEQSTQENVEAVSAEGIEEVSQAETPDEESTLYQPEKEDEYREAAIVIVLAVVLMLLAGLGLKNR